MTALVIDGLEFVEVEQDEADRNAVALRVLHLAVELLLEGPMVAESGERIQEGLGHGGFIAPLELCARRDERRDDGGLQDQADGYHGQHGGDPGLQDQIVKHDPQAEVGHDGG